MAPVRHGSAPLNYSTGGFNAKSLLAAIAALTVASAMATIAAEAKDGCGKGLFFMVANAC
jgi:hypothetical protein